MGLDQSGRNGTALEHGLSRRAALLRCTGIVAGLGVSLRRQSSIAAQEGTPMTDATPSAGGSPTVFSVRGAALEITIPP